MDSIVQFVSVRYVGSLSGCVENTESSVYHFRRELRPSQEVRYVRIIRSLAGGQFQEIGSYGRKVLGYGRKMAVMVGRCRAMVGRAEQGLSSMIEDGCLRPYEMVGYGRMMCGYGRKVPAVRPYGSHWKSGCSAWADYARKKMPGMAVCYRDTPVRHGRVRPYGRDWIQDVCSMGRLRP
ncbi:hypothetical protein OROGR_005450 [Orobanche gracilis]